MNLVAAGTKLITRTGTTTVEAMVSGRHKLLTANGVWSQATVRHHGIGRVRIVALSRCGVVKLVFSPPQQSWLLRTRRGRLFQKTTDELAPGDALEMTFPDAPVGRAVDRLSAARGFVFGDGSRKPGGNAFANFCGAKDAVMIPLFDGVGNDVRTYGAVKRITGLPTAWKTEGPNVNDAPEVIFGWLAGYFAADGDVDKTGRPTMTSASLDNLQMVRSLAQAVGVGSFGIRTRVSTTRYSHGPTNLHLVGLMRGDLTPEFFLIPAHRERYEVGRAAAERRRWRVASIQVNCIEAELYRVVNGHPQSFAIEDNILIGSCSVD